MGGVLYIYKKNAMARNLSGTHCVGSGIHRGRQINSGDNSGIWYTGVFSGPLLPLVCGIRDT